MYLYKNLNLRHRTQHRKILAVFLMAAVALYALLGSVSVYAQSGSITITQQVDGYDDGRTFDFVVNTAADVTTPSTFVDEWGGEGSGEGQLDFPRDITVDQNGNIFVIDGNNHRIQKFNSDGLYIGQWGTEGSGDGQFQYMHDLAVSEDGYVYVTDGNRVQKFDSDGLYISQWGTAGTGAGEFNSPRGIAVDLDGNIFVTDMYNHRIQKFDADGTYLVEWNFSSESDTNNFEHPSDIVIDSAGNVYVSATGSPEWFQIQKFDSAGNHLTGWGKFYGEGGLFGDGGIQLAVDSSDNIYVADAAHMQVFKYDNVGNLLTQWGEREKGDGHISEPHGIAIDSVDNVYLSSTDFYYISPDEPLNNNIVKYSPATIDTPVSGLTSGQSHTLTEQNNSQYRITQVAQDGMPLDGVSCDSGVSSESIENGIAIELNGESVTCTFTNHNVNAGKTVRLDNLQGRINGPSTRYQITNLESEQATITQLYYMDGSSRPRSGTILIDAGSSSIINLRQMVYALTEVEFDSYVELSSDKLMLATILPTAYFEATTTEINPLTAQFRPSTTGSVDSFQWDFGDGNSSTDSEPAHTYSATGTYTVTLTVIDTNDNSHSYSDLVYMAEENQMGKSIRLDNIQRQLTGPSSRYRITDISEHGDSATFTQRVYDAEGNLQYEPISQGLGSEGSIILDLTDRTPSKFWLLEGDFAGYVEITSDHPILVTRLPSAYFEIPQADGTGVLEKAFTSSTLGNVTDWQWEFGDGNSGGNSETSHTYSAAGIYTVTLTVADTNDNSYSYTKLVNITGSESYLGNSIQLDNIQRLSNEPSSRYRITNLGPDELEVNKDFYENNDARYHSDIFTIAGDKSLIVDLSEDPSSGNYYVGLGFEGYVKIDSYDGEIVVTRLPSAIFDSTQQVGLTPLEVTFDSSTLGNVTKWLWDFGDGNTSTEVTPTHTYTTAGKHTVTLTVSDNGGETYTVSKTEYIKVTDTSTVNTQVSGLITDSTQWTIDGSPYLVTGPLLVDNEATLTIDPGVEVRFMTDLSLDVAGELVAIGTEDQPILFTAADPATGPWGNIRFLDDSKGTLFDEVGDYYDGSIVRYTEIAYAGSREHEGAIVTCAVDASNTALLVEHSYFHDITGCSVQVSGEQSRVVYNRFINSQFLSSRGYTAVIRSISESAVLSHNVITSVDVIYDDERYNNFSAISSYLSDALIEENNISGINSDTSIEGYVHAISFSGDRVTIRNNQIQDVAGYGIGNQPTFPSHSLIIKNNRIINSSQYGMSLDVGPASDISYNEVTGSEIGLHFRLSSEFNAHHNIISANSTGLLIKFSSGQFYQNNISNNAIGVDVSDHPVSSATLTLNSIYDNTEYNLRNSGSLDSSRVNATQNWWGTTDPTAIAAGIYDWNDNSQKGIVNFEPILTETPDTNAVPDNVTEPVEVDAKPLVLVYAVLDNNLGESWTRLVNNLEAGATDDVDVRLLIDGPADDGDVYVYDIIGGNDPFCPSLLNPTCDGRYVEGTNFWEFETEDTANPTSLYEFLTKAHAAYPNATQTIVSLVGHGSGWAANVLPGQPRVWKDQNDTLGGMLWDDHPQAGEANSNSLSTLALGSALQSATAASGKRIDLLYLDGCSMGMAEVAYELRDSTDYLLSSPNIDWASFNYNNLLPEVATVSDARTLGQRWLEIEAAELRNNPGHPFTLALSDLGEIDTLENAVDTLGSELQNVLPTDRESISTAYSNAERFDSNFDGVLDNNDSYIDLADFANELAAIFPEDGQVQNAAQSAPSIGVKRAAEEVQAAMDSVVIAKDYESGVPWVYSDQMWQWDSFGGLGVYLPLGVDEQRRQLFYNKANLTWAEATSWDEFLETFWAGAVRSASIGINSMPVCRATTDNCEGLANPLDDRDDSTTPAENPLDDQNSRIIKLFMPITLR